MDEETFRDSKNAIKWEEAELKEKLKGLGER